MLTFKVVIIGDPSVGKTSIVTRFTHKRFASHVSSTIGASFTSYTLDVEEEKVRLNLWDTAGQERYRSMVSMYYRDADYCIIVFDIVEHTTDNVRYWITEYLNKTANQHPKFVLVANKTDLDKNAIINDEIYTLANEYDVDIYKTSAANGSQVEELFEYIGKTLVNMPVEHRLTVQPKTKHGTSKLSLNMDKYHNCCY